MNAIKKWVAYMLLMLGFSMFLPLSREKANTKTEKWVLCAIGFACVSGGFSIYSNVLKKEMREEIKKQSLP